MSFIEWNDSYSVNISEIDTQHQNLVGILNKLHDAMQNGKAREVLDEVLNEMANYTQYHFETEEKYFDLYDYPDSEKHKAEHKELLNQTAELMKKFNAGERVITIDLLNFLKGWLHEHIAGSDNDYGPFLNNKGVY